MIKLALAKEVTKSPQASQYGRIGAKKSPL